MTNLRKGACLPGFTLIEILASVVIFTAVVGVLFSALAAMQRTDLFRRDNQAVAQAANYAFEPLIQRLKEADAKESLQTSQGCVTVQGYYATTNASVVVEEAVLNGSSMYTFSNAEGHLVVITAEKIFVSGQDSASGQGSSRAWVRRDYFVRANSQNPNNKTLVEQTFEPAQQALKWPAPLTCGSPAQHWQPAVEIGSTKAVEKELTASDVTVDNFEVKLIAATLPATGAAGEADIAQHAPLISVSLTVSKPQSKVAQPVTLRTTLTPTFSYGETRD